MKFFLCSLCLAAAALGGCVQRPLTDSEFRGFCYTTIEGRTASCDTIGMCNEFDTDVLSTKQASRADCAKGCSAVYNRQYTANEFNGCAPTLLAAYNWCMKYCNTNYPQ